jgi:hypothetical protein
MYCFVSFIVRKMSIDIFLLLCQFCSAKTVNRYIFKMLIFFLIFIYIIETCLYVVWLAEHFALNTIFEYI